MKDGHIAPTKNTQESRISEIDGNIKGMIREDLSQVATKLVELSYEEEDGNLQSKDSNDHVLK